MRKLILSAVGSAAFGLLTLGGASAMPMSPAGAAVQHSTQIAPATEAVRWERVCRTRMVWRRDYRGRPIRVRVRDCDRVWVGPRRPGPYRPYY